MKLKNIILFLALTFAVSLGKEEKTTYISSENDYNKHITYAISNHSSCNSYVIQGEETNTYYEEYNFHTEEYYMKNYTLYDIPEDKVLLYPKTKTKVLLRIGNMIQKNIYLYHALNKLGKT